MRGTRERLPTAHDWLLDLFAGDVDLKKITAEYLWSFLFRYVGILLVGEAGQAGVGLDYWGPCGS